MMYRRAQAQIQNSDFYLNSSRVNTISLITSANGETFKPSWFNDGLK